MEILARWQDPTIDKLRKENKMLWECIDTIKTYVSDNTTSFIKKELLEIIEEVNKNETSE